MALFGTVSSDLNSMANMITNIFLAKHGDHSLAASMGKGGKPSYNYGTGSFAQNRRKAVKKSWCKRTKRF